MTDHAGEQLALVGEPQKVEWPEGPITPEERRKRERDYNYEYRKKWEQKLRDDRKQALENGIHPATGVKLADNGETCGSCAFCFRRPGTSGTYWKCEHTATRGQKTDIRKSWPACEWWTEELNEGSDA